MTMSHRVPPQLLCLMAALGVGIFTACLPVQASPARHTASVRRSMPDAFLPAPAQGLSSLLTQVQSDPTVRRRYAAYFHVPESRIAAYLRANLVVRRLSQASRYTVYFVRPNGLIYPTMLTVPKGSAVFALKDGPPVMTCQGGNPLVRYQTAQEIHIVRANPTQTVVKVSPSEQEQIIIPNQVQETVVSTVEQTPIYQPAPSDLSVSSPAEPVTPQTDAK
jgi:hypothetical protein